MSSLTCGCDTDRGIYCFIHQPKPNTMDDLTELMLNYSAEMYKYRNILNPTTKWENLTAHQRSVVSSYRDELLKHNQAKLQEVDRAAREDEVNNLYNRANGSVYFNITAQQLKDRLASLKGGDV